MVKPKMINDGKFDEITAIAKAAMEVARVAKTPS